MFPLNSEYPYILDNGQRTTLKDAIDSSFNDEKITKFLDPSTPVRPTVWFSFDAPNYDSRATILEENGFRGCFAFRNDANMTATMLKLVAAGHDYSIYSGNKDAAKPANTASVADWIAYIQPVITYLNNNGIYFPTLYSPNAHFCTANQMAAAASLGLIYARANTVDTDNTASAGAGWIYTKVKDFKPTSTYIKANSISAGVATVKGLIDDTITNNYTLCLFSHTYSQDSYTEAEYREIVEYVRLKVDHGVLDCLTPRQYYDKYRREIDFRNALIDIRAIQQALET